MTRHYSLLVKVKFENTRTKSFYLTKRGSLDLTKFVCFFSLFVFFQEYNFAIKTEWNGTPIIHAPITFQISAQDSRVVLISVSGPFFDDPEPPPCAVGSACDELWDFEGMLK